MFMTEIPRRTFTLPTARYQLTLVYLQFSTSLLQGEVCSNFMKTYRSLLLTSKKFEVQLCMSGVLIRYSINHKIAYSCWMYLDIRLSGPLYGICVCKLKKAINLTQVFWRTFQVEFGRENCWTWYGRSPLLDHPVNFRCKWWAFSWREKRAIS